MRLAECKAQAVNKAKGKPVSMWIVYTTSSAGRQHNPKARHTTANLTDEDDQRAFFSRIGIFNLFKVERTVTGAQNVVSVVASVPTYYDWYLSMFNSGPLNPQALASAAKYCSLAHIIQVQTEFSEY